MKKTSILIFFILNVILASCEILSYSESISPIIEAKLPSSCQLGETISSRVQHVVLNGCGRYSRQEATIDGKVITIKFYGKYPKGKICPANIPTLETLFYFTPSEKGDYYFRFYQDNFDGKEFVMDTLRVK